MTERYSYLDELILPTEFYNGPEKVYVQHGDIFRHVTTGKTYTYDGGLKEWVDTSENK